MASAEQGFAACALKQMGGCVWGDISSRLSVRYFFAAVITIFYYDFENLVWNM